VLTGKRLLIIEDEFLIALDMQRVLEGAGAGESVLARNFEEAAALGDGIANFDLVIMHPPPANDLGHPVVLERIASAGSAVVVCSAFRGLVNGTVLENHIFLDKPFADEELLAACVEALAQATPR
jgi:DNA-binding NtrC family response regulator